MKFDTETLLTVTTGRLLTKHKNGHSGIEDLYEILDYMTQDKVYTHSLPDFMAECRPYLLEKFPELGKVDPEELDDVEPTTEAVQAWVDSCKEAFALRDDYDVDRLPEEVHKRTSPVNSFLDLVKDHE